MITRVIIRGSEAMAAARRRNRKKRITLAEIAARTGVSRQVVAAVLNPERKSNIRFSDHTRRRVLKAVERSNWRPNRTASALANRRHRTIGILVDNFGTIPAAVLPAMMERARVFGQVITLDSLHRTDRALPLFVREDSVDAIVVFEDIPAPLNERIDELRIPCVQVNTNTRDLPGCVTFDEEGAMRKAAAHFAESGRYRTLLFHADRTNGYWVQARIDGLTQAAGDVGMREPYLVQFDGHPYNPAYYRENVESIKQTLRSHRRIDSVILMQDRMAPMFYQAAEELGKRIPDDMAVVAMHNTGVAQVVSPPLSTLHMHPDELGHYVVEVANAGIDGDDEYRSPAAITYDLMVWASSSSDVPPDTAKPQVRLTHADPPAGSKEIADAQ